MNPEALLNIIIALTKAIDNKEVTLAVVEQLKLLPVDGVNESEIINEMQISKYNVADALKDLTNKEWKYILTGMFGPYKFVETE